MRGALRSGAVALIAGPVDRIGIPLMSEYIAADDRSGVDLRPARGDGAALDPRPERPDGAGSWSLAAKR